MADAGKVGAEMAKINSETEWKRIGLFKTASFRVISTAFLYFLSTRLTS